MPSTGRAAELVGLNGLWSLIGYSRGARGYLPKQNPQKRLRARFLRPSRGFDVIRCYTSRVENGHTVPTIETLEKLERALEVPLYVLFYDGEEPPAAPEFLNRKGTGETEWGESRKESLILRKFRRALSQLNVEDRRLLLFMANKMALRKISRPRRGK